MEFGVAATPARLLGRVTDDAGNGIAGIRVLLARGAQQLVATTGTDGAFSFAAAPGEWQLSLLTDSVPAGHSLAGTEARAVQLDLAQPANANVSLRAHRSISGRAAPHAEIAMDGRSVRADAEGRFSIRSLAPGTVTLTSGGVTRRIDVPAGPAALSVDFTPQVAASGIRTEVAGERQARLGEHVVQLGAFRIHANALAAAARARQAGVTVVLQTSGALTFVRTTPLPTRAEAQAIAGRLTRAGVEAVVVSRN